MRRRFYIGLFLIVATLAVYWQVQKHDFTYFFDDNEYVTNNVHVQAGLTRESIVWAFTTTDEANWHPLTWLSHMLDYQLYGLDPSGHHLTNVLLHLANTLLLFLVLRGMTGALWRSGLVAALFALHPLHVESVAWVAERKDVLSTFFWMLTPGIKRYLLTFLTFALGLMAKPMLVTLPCVMLLLDYWPLDRCQIGQEPGETNAFIQAAMSPKEQGSCSLRLLWEKTPFFAVAAVSSVVTYLVQQSGGAFHFGRGLPLKIRIANGLVSYVHYIGKTFWPGNLGVFYPHPGSGLPMWQATILAVRRYPYLIVGWLWYLGSLVPVIGLVQVGEQALADRYTYVPLIGLFIIIAWGLHDLLAGRFNKKIILTGEVALLSVLMVLTWRQVQHWKNSTALFEHTIQITANNHVAHEILGIVLEDQGKTEEALVQYTKALETQPQCAAANYRAGAVWASLGNSEEAIAHYSEAVKYDPNYVNAHNSLGKALVEQGRLSEAILHFSKALEIRPDYADAQNNMGSLLVEQGKLDEAVSHFAEALRINPDHIIAHNNIGDALARMGRFDEAMTHYYQALRIKPDYADAQNNLGVLLNLVEVHNNLGVVLARQGRFDEAISHFHQALQLKPDYLQARNNLENVLQEKAKTNEKMSSISEP
jgi:tetratricopeptide (TPR) repeat protein